MIFELPILDISGHFYYCTGSDKFAKKKFEPNFARAVDLEPIKLHTIDWGLLQHFPSPTQVPEKQSPNPHEQVIIKLCIFSAMYVFAAIIELEASFGRNGAVRRKT